MTQTFRETRLTDDPAYREAVFADMAETIGIRIRGYTPVWYGLLHMKWIVDTSAGKLFVKCYHPNRYRLSEPALRRNVERSLAFQQELHERAGLCPGIVRESSGAYVRITEDGRYYVVMDHFAGRPPLPGRVDCGRMRKLGQAIGRMHAIFSGIPATGDDWQPSLATMKQKHSANLEAARAQAVPNPKALRSIERQGRIMDEIDLAMFDRLRPGWAHWDLWADNWLFGADDELRMIDFDTVQYGYPEIDTARALLSAALHEDELRPDAAAAFLAGYREQRDFPPGRLPLAFKLLWCRESHWWLKGTMDDVSAPPKRFAEELVWLTDRWDELDERYGNW